MEGEAQQTSLAAALGAGVDVEEDRCSGRARLEVPDIACLLDDEQPARAVPGIRDEDRVVEAGANRAKADVDRRRVERDGVRAGRGQSDQQRGEEEADAEPSAAGVDQRQPSALKRKNVSCDQRSLMAVSRSTKGSASSTAATSTTVSSDSTSQAPTAPRLGWPISRWGAIRSIRAVAA